MSAAVTSKVSLEDKPELLSAHSPTQATMWIGAALLLISALIDPWWNRVAAISGFNYSAPCMLVEMLHSRFALVVLISGLALTIVTWHQTWDCVPSSSACRVIVTACAVCLAWAYSTYPYNFHAQQYHLVDRLALVGLAIGIAFRPAFICSFAILITLSVGQFSQPLAYSWTDKVPLLETMYVASLFQFTRAAYRKLEFTPLLYCLLMLWSAFYLSTGMAKLRIGWAIHNLPGNIVPGAYLQNGWLAGLGWEGVIRIAEMANSLSLIISVSVLLIELGAGMLLFHRRIAIAVFLGATAMHLGIFALTGICFWKWLVVDIAWVLVLIRFVPDIQDQVFGLRSGLIGLVAVALWIGLSSRDVWLGWFDSRFVYAFEVVASDEQDNQWLVTPARLAPYDLPFAQGRFYFTTQTRQISDCLGAVLDPESLQSIDEFADADSQGRFPLQRLRDAIGVIRYDGNRKERLNDFFNHYISAHNSGRTSSRYWFGAPQHIWTSVPAHSAFQPLPDDQPINSISIRLKEFVVRGRQYRQVHEETVFEFLAAES